MASADPAPAPASGVTQRRIWALAWPVMLSNITVPLLGLVDTAILGHLPDAVHLGAVAVGSQLFTLLLWSFGFLRMGTTALTARTWGQQANPVQVLQHALWLAGPVLLLVLLAAACALPWLLPLLSGNQSGANGAIEQGAAGYLLIRLFAAPAVLAQYALTGWFIGLGRTRIPLLVLTVANLVNALLDYLFVFHLHMTSEGVALGSVIADYCALLLALTCARRNGFHGIGPWPGAGALRPMLKVNRHLFVRTLCLLAVLAFFTAQGARQGELILAANAVLISLLMLISNALDGFAHAAEALTGQALGRRDSLAVQRTIVLTGVNMLLMALLLSLLFILGSQQLWPLLTDNPELLPVLQRYQWFLFLLPLAGFPSFWLDGIFIGAQATAAMRNAMIGAALLVFLPIWWLTQSLGNDGLWWAFYSFLGARALLVSGKFLTLFRHSPNFM